MRICVHKQGEGGVAFYRIVQPYSYLRDEKLAQVFIFDNQIHSMERIVNEQQIADILVFQMPWGKPILEAMQVNQQRAKPKKIVLEYDDDVITGTNPFNKAYKVFGTEETDISFYDEDSKKMVVDNKVPHTINPDGSYRVSQWKDGKDEFNLAVNRENLAYTKEAIANADLVTCTTMELGKTLRKFRPKGEIAILPNLVDSRRWLPMKKNDTNEIRIGWQGGDAHYLDIFKIVPALDKVLAKYPNVKLVFKGGHFPALFEQCKDRIEWLNWDSDIYTHPLSVRDMKCDIMLAPLIDDKFNRCKSDLKWLEYAMLKVPGVYADVCYKGSVVHGKTGLIAKWNDTEEWFNNICQLVDNVSMRKEIADKAFERVYNFHNVNQSARYLKAFEKLLQPKKILVPA